MRFGMAVASVQLDHPTPPGEGIMRGSRGFVVAGLLLAASLASPARAGVNAWTSTGIVGGSTRTIAIDPTSPATMYAGTKYNGVFKTTNGGATWTAANIGMPNTLVVNIVIDPVTTTNVYASTDGQGVFRSTDGGATWTAINNGLSGALPLLIYGLAIDPVTRTTLYAGTAGGVYKTTNSGASWSLASTGLSTTWVNSVTINPTAPGTLYAGTSGG